MQIRHPQLLTIPPWGFVKTEKAPPLIGVSALFSVAATLMALAWPNVVVFVTEGFKVMTVLLPAIIAAMLLRKPSSVAGFVSVASGAITWLLTRLLWRGQGHWGYVIGFGVAALILLVVYRVERSWRTVEPADAIGEGPDEDIASEEKNQ